MGADTLVGLGFALLGGLIAIYALYMQNRAEDTQSWKSTTGLMVEARIVERTTDDGIDYKLRVGYSYRVGDEVYHGRRISFALKDYYDDRAEAEYALTDYLDRDQVEVYYNPKNPRDAVLERGAGRGGSMGALIAGGLFFACGIIWLVWQRGLGALVERFGG